MLKGNWIFAILLPACLRNAHSAFRFSSLPFPAFPVSPFPGGLAVSRRLCVCYGQLSLTAHTRLE